MEQLHKFRVVPRLQETHVCGAHIKLLHGTTYQLVRRTAIY